MGDSGEGDVSGVSADIGEMMKAWLYGDPQADAEPRPFTFGENLNWKGALTEVFLYVELPFWLMVRPTRVHVEYEEVQFSVDIFDSQFEVFAGMCTDSRRTCVYRGPRTENGWEPSGELAEVLSTNKVNLIERSCKTVLRLQSKGLVDAFRVPDDDELPPIGAQIDAYWASLCEGHIPVINELIQRYRLATYDPFTYEVSSWDVPVWQVRQGEASLRAVLVPYAEWDQKPVIVERSRGTEQQQIARPFEFTSGAVLGDTASTQATPGEFDLLDAGSLMERGDYTGAVRRVTTAIEAVVEWALRRELGERGDSSEDVIKLLKVAEMNFPKRLRQLRELMGIDEKGRQRIPVELEREFARTRQLRHDIVHRAKRITYPDRGVAQRSVDTGRWLYNKIENLPERAKLRDRGLLRSAGRSALAPRFPTRVTAEGVRVLTHADQAST